MKAIYEPTGRAKEYADLACNLYRGCTHGCRYCFGPAVLRMTREDFQAEARLRPGILKALAREAPGYRGDPRRVHFCFTCDPYPPPGRQGGYPIGYNWPTREALQIMRKEEVSFQVLTKGGMRAARDFDLYRPGSEGDCYGTTLAMVSEELRREWEPGAPSVNSRIDAALKAREMGIYTWLSLEPVLDPDEALRVIAETARFFDEIRVGMLNHWGNPWGLDWAAFALQAVEKLQQTRRRWMLKDSLAALLPEGVPARSEQA